MSQTVPDAVDHILAQWARERPDLDVTPMGLIGRLGRLRAHLTRAHETAFQRHGLNGASFDLLATLRRSGPPFRLSPSDLLDTMMITSGTMTNRIDQLEKQGLVERLPHPDDRRALLVALTDKGRDVIDAAVTDHIENQHHLVEPLTLEERTVLDGLLKKYLTAFETLKGLQKRP
ncbi:MAG: MarR family winged helix-turn-helix transcriptional regulator [Allorhizobium sp.]